MTGPDSRRRAYSSRVLSLIATIVSVYALGLYLSISPVVGRMTSSGSVICGEPARTFATPGRMGWPHGLHPQDSTGRLIHMRHDRFPYSAGQRPPYLRDEFQFVALGLRPGDPGWTHVPRVDGHPLWVKRSLFIDDKLLVWGAYQVSPDAQQQDVLLVLDEQGQVQLVRNRQRLAPLATDAGTRSLVSIEERETIYGGQPAEEERPPHALVFEPLDEHGIPQAEGSHRHHLRKLKNLLADGDGNVYLVRWLAGPRRFAQSRYGDRLLEKYSIRGRRILWSTRIDDIPVQEYHQRHSRLVQGESGIRFEEDHPIPIDEDGRELRNMWRARIYDRTSGAVVGEEAFPPPSLNLDRRSELEIGGTRYALRKRGWRRECLDITPVDL